MDALRFSTPELTEHAVSDFRAFIVPLDHRHTYIRVLAHYEAGSLLGGTAPTFLIKAGNHDATPCASGSTTKILGSGGAVVGEASVRRTDDTFLVTLTHLAPSGPWSVAIRNDESLPQTFYGFIADTAEKTCKPWLLLLDDMTLGGVSAGFQATADSLSILNVGTAPLRVFDGFQAGDRFGPPESPVTIGRLPGPVQPHRVGAVVAQCPRLPPYVGGYVQKLPALVPNNASAPVPTTIRLVHPVLDDTYCRTKDGCVAFDGQPDQYGGDYYCRCGHNKYQHNIYDDPPDRGRVY